MSGKITDLTAIGAIDRSADLLEVVDISANTSNQVTPNNLLGITGNPVGHSDTQTLSNKTLGNTNTLTLKASLFTLQDATDTTKQANFSISGNTTGTTRIYTLPNASVTLASLTGTETLTNKTLTSPTINTPTIQNPTLNTDLISEYTASNGVTVGGVNLKSGALNTNNSVVSSNITAGAVQPQALNSGTGSGWAWQNYTPTWTNFTAGNATITANYIQTGKTVTYNLTVVWGSTTSLSGTPTFTLPITAHSSVYNGLGNTGVIGSGILLRQGVAFRLATVVALTAITAKWFVWDASTAYLKGTDVTAAITDTWASTDVFTASGTYQAA